MTTAIVDLHDYSDWDPALLAGAAIVWRSRGPLLNLDLMVDRLYPDATAERGTPVITPSGLDAVRGGVRKRSRTYRGPVYQSQGFASSLRLGDLLVPITDGPVLLVSENLLGSPVSASFMALRPKEVDPLWLWAVLNCQTGRAARQLARTTILNRGLPRGHLLDLTLPVPNADWEQLRYEVDGMERRARGYEEDAAETWWRTVDLRSGTEWRFVLATPNPEILHDGDPLSSFCSDIARGARLPQGSERPVPGWLPVADVNVLRGEPVRRWVPEEATTVRVAEGDMLIAAIGRPALATIADKPLALDPSVFRLRLSDEDDAPRLLGFLNGQEGYARRQMLQLGALSRILRRKDLERLPVPRQRLGFASKPDTRPLAVQLEQLLWT